jgi:hypothetical protein
MLLWSIVDQKRYNNQIMHKTQSEGKPDFGGFAVVGGLLIKRSAHERRVKKEAARAVSAFASEASVCLPERRKINVYPLCVASTRFALNRRLPNILRPYH